MKSKKEINIPLDQYINFALYNKKTGYYIKKNPFGSRHSVGLEPDGRVNRSLKTRLQKKTK